MDIQVKNIIKFFGKKEVLKGISFSITEGKCIGILGENGSGKSTLFGVLTGPLKGKGNFFVDGVDLLKNTKQRRKTVGFIPQEHPLIEELSAYDNLRLWYSKDDIQEQLRSGRLSMLGIGDFLKTRVSKLSGGMKKRLSIACSISYDPQILLLDEPCTALDILCKENIYSYISSHLNKGGTVIIASHDVYELSLCDEIYILKNGVLTHYDGDRELDSLVKALSDE